MFLRLQGISKMSDDEQDVPKRKAFNLKSFVIATLRSASYRYPARSEALKRARIDRGLYQCEHCKEAFKRDLVVLDHKNPVVEISAGFTTWDDYINRMFCPVEGFSVLCSTCHDSKSLIEREMRKVYRAQRKAEEEALNPKPKKKSKKSVKKLDSDT
jgi:hypothetical protein